MKFLGGLGCVLSMWGIIWGIFLPAFLWMAFIGLALMMITCIFLDENS